MAKYCAPNEEVVFLLSLDEKLAVWAVDAQGWALLTSHQPRVCVQINNQLGLDHGSTSFEGAHAAFDV